jgi:hypothetical protein
MRALRLIDELISFSDSWAGLPADAGELIARRRTPQRARGSGIHGLGGDLGNGGADDGPRDRVGRVVDPGMHP